MDKLISEFRQLSASDAASAVVTFSAIISPGLLILWCYAPSYFKDYGIITCLFLSASLTVPLFFLNADLAFHTPQIIKDSTSPQQSIIMYLSAAAAAVMIVLDVPLLICFLLSLNLKIYILSTLAVESFFVFATIRSQVTSQKSSSTR